MIHSCLIRDVRLLLVAALSIQSGLSLAGEAVYTYDSLNRLKRVVEGDSTVVDYSYDAAGNRTSHVVRNGAMFSVSLARGGTGAGSVGGAGRYATGDAVALTAAPDATSAFSGWGPAPCATRFTMPAGNLTCTATFTRNTLRINDVSRAEGNTGSSAGTFTVTLSPASSRTVTVAYATANGTATAGSDYTAASGTLRFAPGENSKTVSVSVRGDTAREPNETFTLALSAPSGATLFDAQGQGTIINDDGPVLRIGDLSRAEGHTGTTAFAFPVTLSPASTGTVTVKYATIPQTAQAGSDYLGTSGTLTFSPGQTSKTVTVSAVGETTVEPNETFAVNLFQPTGATLFDSLGVGTILNDDGPVLRVGDLSRAEGNTGTSPAIFTVTLSPASPGPVTVRYATANGTATAGSDYTAASGTLTFTPGQTSKTVTVNLTGDTLREPNETFTLALSAPTGATLFDAQGQGTLINDDGPVLRIGDLSRAEGHTGTTAFAFPVTLSPASTGTVTVKYATIPQTAQAGSDYLGTSGTLTFSPGQTSKTITVNAVGETTVEPNETFAVNLFQPTGATLFDSLGVGTIRNDD